MSKEYKEYWVEVNIASIGKKTWKEMNGVVDEVARSLIIRLQRCLPIITWHFFYETWGWKTEKEGLPHITFRVEVENGKQKQQAKQLIKDYMKLRGSEEEKDWYFGRHGIINKEYEGEVYRFGSIKRWWLAKNLLQWCSEVALELIIAEKETERLRFCRSDLLHLISNILSRSDYTYKTKAVKLILLEEQDLPTRTFGVCE